MTARPDRDEIEQVLVVPAELFRRLGYFQGFCGNVERYLDELLRPENTSYRPRDQVEKDPGFKQLIPYMIFRHVEAGGRRDRLSVHPRHGHGRGAAAPQAERRHRRAYLGHRRRKKGTVPIQTQGDSPLFGRARRRQSL